MSSLLSTSQISAHTGIFSRHFDTFSANNTLIVHKEPLKTYTVATGDSNYFGYGETSNLDNVTYTPVSGAFPFIRVFDKGLNSAKGAPEVQTKFGASSVKIKVKQDAREFIKNGKNEKFEFDGLVFNDIGEESVQNYLGIKYYYFTLISTL